MMPRKVVVVHDMFGTLFSLDAPTAALRASFPSLSPMRAHAIVMDWYQCVQRDLSMLSTMGAYQSASAIFKEALPRALLQAGLSTQPETEGNSSIFSPGDESMYGPQHALAAQLKNPYPPSVIDPVIDSLQQLTPRPGFEDAFRSLYHSDSNIPVELWAATNGGTELARKLLLAATGKSKNQEEELDVGIFSCDEIQCSKPDPKVYAAIRKKIGLPTTVTEQPHQDAETSSIWFVASHAWDLAAAKKAGFKTCWISYEEFYACPKLFGEPDIVALDLADGARAILEHERQTQV